MTTETAPPPAGAPIEAGQPVFTLDNKKLGTVKEATETHFKVDARFRRDFWLARDQVAFSDELCVGMLFRSDEVELYKLMSATDDSLRRFERPTLPSEPKDANWRGRFPLS